MFESHFFLQPLLQTNTLSLKFPIGAGGHFSEKHIEITTFARIHSSAFFHLVVERLFSGNIDFYISIFFFNYTCYLLQVITADLFHLRHGAGFQWLILQHICESAADRLSWHWSEKLQLIKKTSIYLVLIRWTRKRFLPSTGEPVCSWSHWPSWEDWDDLAHSLKWWSSWPLKGFPVNSYTWPGLWGGENKEVSVPFPWTWTLSWKPVKKLSYLTW